MDHSATFARHFARLVSLLMHDTGNVVEQKMSLRALVAINKNGPVTLIARDSQLSANGEPVPGALTGVQDVADQMKAHSVVGIEVGASSVAADLLGVARLIAAAPSPGDGGEQARRHFAQLGAGTIDLMLAAPNPTPPAAGPASLPVTPTEGVRTTDREAAALLSQLIAADVSKLSHVELLAALDRATSASTRSEVTTRILDDLVLVAEHAVRAGKAQVVAEVFHGVVAREAQLGARPGKNADIRRAYVTAMRRMSKPALLRAVASLIAKKPEGRQWYYEVLDRAGEDGADAVIEQITNARTTEDRRKLMEVFRELKDAIPALKRMLGDSRWFVARNAADLLGELVATDAEDALIALLKHGDDRVRRSATSALLKLGTQGAMQAVYDAVNDKSPEVRLQATAAIATRKDARTSNTLIRAIEDEQDSDVQAAMIAALGRVATPDAIAKLAKMAEPEGRLFRKKTTAFRVAAVQALAEARTPAALAALRELAGDKEREVRDTATRALAHVR
ncbi:MAG TPA: HEAT repeat domain-containing protein [Gemmatimonadaceae bacterium]|nr:HEAT repeat domain-containing protein [Gemmatimonadaceae bacterium]